jgi:hypothetical protein
VEPLSLWEAAKRGAKCSSWPTRFAARPDLGDLRVRGPLLRDTLCRACKDRDRWDLAT